VASIASLWGSVQNIPAAASQEAEQRDANAGAM
jgi:hypothetical protein